MCPNDNMRARGRGSPFNLLCGGGLDFFIISTRLVGALKISIFLHVYLLMIFYYFTRGSPAIIYFVKYFTPPPPGDWIVPVQDDIQLTIDMYLVTTFNALHFYIDTPLEK